jgi:plasmid stability protein
VRNGVSHAGIIQKRVNANTEGDARGFAADQKLSEGLRAAIRKRAENNGRSVSEEVLLVLKKAFPTTREMAKRKNALQRLSNCRFTSSSKDKMPNSLEMIREDRER